MLPANRVTPLAQAVETCSSGAEDLDRIPTQVSWGGKRHHYTFPPRKNVVLCFNGEQQVPVFNNHNLRCKVNEFLQGSSGGRLQLN